MKDFPSHQIFLEKGIDFFLRCAIIIKHLRVECTQRITSMERWLSWSKAHDWKSCVPYKGTEGSNPSLSAKNKAHKRFSVCELFLCPNGNGEFSPKNRLFSPKKYHYSNSISMYSAYPLYLIRLFLSANCIQSSA